MASMSGLKTAYALKRNYKLRTSSYTSPDSYGRLIQKKLFWYFTGCQ